MQLYDWGRNNLSNRNSTKILKVASVTGVQGNEVEVQNEFGERQGTES